jgi:hypothetical protein
MAAFNAHLAAFEEKYGAGDSADALGRLASVKPVAYGYARRTWGFSFN